MKAEKAAAGPLAEVFCLGKIRANVTSTSTGPYFTIEMEGVPRHGLLTDEWARDDMLAIATPEELSPTRIVEESSISKKESDVQAPLFELGTIFVTTEVLHALDAVPGSMNDCLARHLTGDWGIVAAQDRAENEAILNERSFHITSMYETPSGKKLVVLTRITGQCRCTALAIAREF